MLPTVKYDDIVIIICTVGFFCFYVLAIITQILLSRKQEKRFTLVSVVIALGMGFVGSIFTFIALYSIFRGA